MSERPPTRVVAVLGVTGRLGPAVARAFGGWEVRGLSRRSAASGEPCDLAVRVTADRRDTAALHALCDGASTVVDLLGFDEIDATALLQAFAHTRQPPAHLVFASSTAEYGAPNRVLTEQSPRRPDDDYGRGKIAARRRYETEFGSTLHSLILPRLVAAVDHKRREQPYLDAARGGGRALYPGPGTQRQTIAPVDGVAAVVRALAEAPSSYGSAVLNVGPAEPLSVLSAIRALLEGAGIEGEPAHHPDGGWRGPHGPADEIVDTSRVRQMLPAVRWPDPLKVYRELGAWLAEDHEGPARAQSRRPLPLVTRPHQSYAGRRVVDVHDRRRDAIVSRPLPALGELAQRLSPAFYLDVGRPCNSACIYCAVPPHLDTQGYTPVERFAEPIQAGIAAGCDRAIFVGGEPTTYPALPEALAMLRQAGLAGRHVLMTNGLKLAEAGLLDRLVQGGIATLHLSIDTADEQVYDRIGRSRGQFGRQRAGLDVALAHGGLWMYVYTVVTRINAAGIGSLLQAVVERAALARAAPPPVVLAFAKPLGDALTHAEELLVDPAARADLARNAVEAGRALGTTVGVRNLPACLAPELLSHLVDDYIEDCSVDLATGERQAYSHGEYLFHAEPCDRCTHRPFCPGIYREDATRFGTAAYVPI